MEENLRLRQEETGYLNQDYDVVDALFRLVKKPITPDLKFNKDSPDPSSSWVIESRREPVSQEKCLEGPPTSASGRPQRSLPLG